MSRLEARGVSFAYSSSSPLLRQVSLKVEPGQVTAVIGANGAGKTTLLKLLAGRLQPEGGDVLLDGQPIVSRARRWIARRVALSPQFETPTWQLTVEEVVRLGRAPHRGWIRPLTADDHRAVAEALRAMDLSALAGRSVTQLSGGELRRVMFARILAQDPQTVLLDEPTAHLDLKHQEEVCALMKTLAVQRQIAVVVTLHDLNQTAAHVDQVALLHRGSILSQGSPAEVLTPELIEEVYGLPVAVARHPGSGRLWISPCQQKVREPAPEG